MRREPISLAHRETADQTVSINLAAIDMGRILGLCRPQDRVLLEQCLKGCSMSEIAGNEGVSETAIRIRLLRARRYARGRVEGRPGSTRRTHLRANPRRKAA